MRTSTLLMLLHDVRKVGFKEARFVKSTDHQLEDDEVKVTDTISIQLCGGEYMAVTKEDSNGTFLCWPATEDMHIIIETIKSII